MATKYSVLVFGTPADRPLLESGLYYDQCKAVAEAMDLALDFIDTGTCISLRLRSTDTDSQTSITQPRPFWFGFLEPSRR